MSELPRLVVQGLSTSFPTEDGLVRSVADVSFSIAPGKTTALVGESGSGKSVTSLTLMRRIRFGQVGDQPDLDALVAEDR
jgi:peptide/nickel transport system ATP-binding protein